MPETDLGIGRFEHVAGRVSREALTWYDAKGRRHLSQAQERQARFDAVPRLLNRGLSVEEVTEALSLSVEEVRSR